MKKERKKENKHGFDVFEASTNFPSSNEWLRFKNLEDIGSFSTSSIKERNIIFKSY